MMVVNIGKFLSQQISLVKIRIILENNFSPEALRFRPVYGIFSQYMFCACQELPAGVSITVSEWYIFLLVCATFFYIAVR